jgi:hypothetical protein
MTTPRIATFCADEGPISGLERELSQLYGLADRVHERGAALLLRGELANGKSTLLAALVANSPRPHFWRVALAWALYVGAASC